MNQNFISMLDRSAEAMFHPIEVGDFSLSIQASRTHYCEPRQTLESAGMYSAFEMAIFEGGKWVNPLDDERFTVLRGELIARWESGTHSVGAYIPSELVQKIFEHVQNLPKAIGTTE